MKKCKKCNCLEINKEYSFKNYKGEELCVCDGGKNEL